MIYEKPIESERLILRPVALSDCNESYIRWMNDEETNRYMETRWNVQNLETITSFVREIRASDDSYLFAIVEKQSARHIGNIKIGPIHKRYHYANISYFIGEKEFRGRGLATEAIRAVCQFGFQVLNLHRIQAGVIEGNDASARALASCGFRLEGRLADKFVVSGKYADHLIYGLVR